MLLEPFPIFAQSPTVVPGIAFQVLAVLWAASEALLGRHGIRAESLRSDRGSSIIVALSLGSGLCAAFAAAWLRLAPTGAWAGWVGPLLMALGLGLRVFSMLWLGPMFTRIVQIVPGHRLVTSGPYRFVRHPSYSGLILLFAGTGLSLGDWLSLAAMLLLPAIGITYRIMVEERTLLGAFGDEYRAYTKSVRRLIPFLL